MMFKPEPVEEIGNPMPEEGDQPQAKKIAKKMPKISLKR